MNSCSDDRQNIAGIPAGAADGLYPQLVVSSQRGGTVELSLSLLRKPAGTRLGSYQGELTYDPVVLTFASSALPTGVDGLAQLVSPGKVRFVGTALDGIGDMPLMTLHFTRKGEVKASSFAVVFEDVSSAVDLSDLTPAVRAGPPLSTIR
jgi:hypothetical protein